MTLLDMAQRAAHVYLSTAYPEGLPEGTKSIVDELDTLKAEKDLFFWAVLEKEGDRYCLRLGNFQYPHMKLVFLASEQGPVFYVDAHDSHFDVKPNVPGFDQLLKLREANKLLKQRIEADWISEGLPVFTSQTKIKPSKADCKGLTVLAVDDEIQILDMLSLIATSMGAELMRASGAEEARQLIRDRGVPTMIFCDIMMPGESGYDFLKWLQKEKLEVPIIFITGLNKENIRSEGVMEVLQKPFTPKKVIKLMKAVKKGEV